MQLTVFNPNGRENLYRIWPYRGLIEKLGWNHGQKLRPYVYDDILIIEKLDVGKCVTLYKYKLNNGSFSTSISSFKQCIIDSLGWVAGDKLFGYIFHDKLIVQKYHNRKRVHFDGFSYVFECLKSEKFVFKKIQELFEA